mmetsp:Transcript_83508/g.122220  ORF Transcript_83508/g.122220 Transcript_83508/m.122220 type:complete len:89 (+) Transcript_83508:247-513(+)
MCTGNERVGVCVHACVCVCERKKDRACVCMYVYTHGGQVHDTSAHKRVKNTTPKELYVPANKPYISTIKSYYRLPILRESWYGYSLSL